MGGGGGGGAGNCKETSTLTRWSQFLIGGGGGGQGIVKKHPL